MSSEGPGRALPGEYTVRSGNWLKEITVDPKTVADPSLSHAFMIGPIFIILLLTLEININIFLLCSLTQNYNFLS